MRKSGGEKSKKSLLECVCSVWEKHPLFIDKDCNRGNLLYIDDYSKTILQKANSIDTLSNIQIAILWNKQIFWLKLPSYYFPVELY